MTTSLLNYKLEGNGECIVLIHGLFGSLDNLGLLARELKNHYQVISVDLRNHGQSFHHDVMDYESMAADVMALLAHLNISQYSVIGHSMGGKVAMALTAQQKESVKKLIVLDMSPVAYQQRRHDNVFAGLNAVIEQAPNSRQQALEILSQHVQEDGVRLFLSKSLYKVNDAMQWRFNAPVIIQQYASIMNWHTLATQTTPTLFVKGAQSDYLLAEHQSLIAAQFPNSKAHVVSGTGHWLHAEKPQEVLRVIQRFLDHKAP